MSDNMVLYEETETSDIKYISFIGESNTRFDLAIIITDRFFGKSLVVNIQSGRTAIIGSDDLEEPDYIQEAFQLSEEEAKDLYEYLSRFFY